MWTLAQVEEAFGILRQASPGVDLNVWFCDRGLCVFKAPSPEGLPREIQARLEALSWTWNPDDDDFGEPCWYLFRSD